MKSSFIIGGLAAGGVAIAGLVYSGALGATENATVGDKAKSIVMPKITDQMVEQALAEAATLALSSPEPVISVAANTPKELKQQLQEAGGEWVTAGVAKIIDSDVATDCPGQTADGPGQTLHIRYVIDPPTDSNGRPTILFTDVPVPAPSGSNGFFYQSPMVKEVIVRDGFEWERKYQTKWWSGVNQDWVDEMREEQARLDVLFMEVQDTSPQQAINLARRIAQIEQGIRTAPVDSMNRSVNDIIEVTAPSPAWSFAYDNFTKKGDPLEQIPAADDYTQYVNEIEANVEGIIAALEPLARFGQTITDGGTKEILGYTCHIIKSSEIDAETCIAEIDGREITLWKRMDSAVSTAVYLDTEPCVSLAQFMPPVDVEFAENW